MNLHPVTLPLYVAGIALAIAGASVLVVALIVGAAFANEAVAAWALTRP